VKLVLVVVVLLDVEGGSSLDDGCIMSFLVFFFVFRLYMAPLFCNL